MSKANTATPKPKDEEQFRFSRAEETKHVETLQEELTDWSLLIVGLGYFGLPMQLQRACVDALNKESKLGDAETVKAVTKLMKGLVKPRTTKGRTWTTDEDVLALFIEGTADVYEYKGNLGMAELVKLSPSHALTYSMEKNTATAPGVSLRYSPSGTLLNPVQAPTTSKKAVAAAHTLVDKSGCDALQTVSLAYWSFPTDALNPIIKGLDDGIDGSGFNKGKKQEEQISIAGIVSDMNQLKRLYRDRLTNDDKDKMFREVSKKTDAMPEAELAKLATFVRDGRHAAFMRYTEDTRAETVEAINKLANFVLSPKAEELNPIAALNAGRAMRANYPEGCVVEAATMVGNPAVPKYAAVVTKQLDAAKSIQLGEGIPVVFTDATARPVDYVYAENAVNDEFNTVRDAAKGVSQRQEFVVGCGPNISQIHMGDGVTKVDIKEFANAHKIDGISSERINYEGTRALADLHVEAGGLFARSTVDIVDEFFQAGCKVGPISFLTNDELAAAKKELKPNLSAFGQNFYPSMMVLARGIPIFTFKLRFLGEPADLAAYLAPLGNAYYMHFGKVTDLHNTELFVSVVHKSVDIAKSFTGEVRDHWLKIASVKPKSFERDLRVAIGRRMKYVAVGPLLRMKAALIGNRGPAVWNGIRVTPSRLAFGITKEFPAFDYNVKEFHTLGIRVKKPSYSEDADEYAAEVGTLVPGAREEEEKPAREKEAREKENKTDDDSSPQEGEEGEGQGAGTAEEEEEEEDEYPEDV